MGASFSSLTLSLLYSFPTIVVWRIQITTSRDIRPRKKRRKGKICTRKRESPDGAAGAAAAAAIILRSLQRGTDFNHADRPTANEPTLSEIYVSSKCETNSALPSFLRFLLNNCPSPSSVFGVLMLIRRCGARRGLIRERREREGVSGRGREEQIFPFLPSLLPSFLLSFVVRPFVSRFGTVPIYLSIFCAMHFSAKLTPSSLGPRARTRVDFSFFSLLSMFLCTFPLHLSRLLLLILLPFL